MSKTNAIADIDFKILSILFKIEESNEPKRNEIIAICKDILAEKDEEKKIGMLVRLIRVGSGIASIYQLVNDINIYYS
ncbi:MAG: hypothetical protein JSU99_02630 [Nitrospiraceae bacterium]|nr:MAG: hypothetical protein JSU99_02630 [Nitrospiraceae bacterium]